MSRRNRRGSITSSAVAAATSAAEQDENIIAGAAEIPEEGKHSSKKQERERIAEHAVNETTSPLASQFIPVDDDIETPTRPPVISHSTGDAERKRSTSHSSLVKNSDGRHDRDGRSDPSKAGQQRGASDLPITTSASTLTLPPQSTTAVDGVPQGPYPPRSKSVYEDAAGAGGPSGSRLRSRSSLPNHGHIAIRHDGRGQQHTTAARRSTRHQKDEGIAPRPLRSLTPSSSLPNLPSSSQPSAHSYPFLAEAPPERPSIRQRRRLASMPSGSGSEAKPRSRSRSPPLPVQIASTSSPSSSRPKRSREASQPSSSRGQASSSKRVASGSSIPVASKRASDDDDDDSDEREVTTTSIAPPMEYHQGKKYELIIIQQPTRGCAFGSNLLSRLPCAPPLIVQLKVTDEEGKEVSTDAEEPFLICHASLFTSEGQSADLLSPVQSTQTSPSTSSSTQASPVITPRRSRRNSRGAGAIDAPTSRSRQDSTASSPTTAPPLAVPTTPVRMLYGSLAATPQRFPSPSSSSEEPTTTYFIFPEVCVRAKGRYRIKLALMKLPVRRGASASAHATTPPPPTTAGSDLLATVHTTTFEVFLAHEYVVPYVTDLTRFFARHGAALPLPSGDRTDG